MWTWYLKRSCGAIGYDYVEVPYEEKDQRKHYMKKKIREYIKKVTQHHIIKKNLLSIHLKKNVK